MKHIQSEKREVTGSTPVPTTGKPQVKGYFDELSVSYARFRAHYVPIENENRFNFVGPKRCKHLAEAARARSAWSR